MGVHFPKIHKKIKTKQMMASIGEDGNLQQQMVDITITVDVDPVRFERQFDKAQYMLDSQIMTDMVPYMPMVTGNFIDRTKAESAVLAGTGYVCAGAAPYGRYLYEGEKMVSTRTGSAYARAGEKKVPVSQYAAKTAKLQYNKAAHPQVTDHWFDAAKREHGDDWVRMTKAEAGGGKKR